MLLKLKPRIASCLDRAAEAEQRALEASDPQIRSDNEKLAKSWCLLAKSFEFVESLEQFLADKKHYELADFPGLDELLLPDDQNAPPEGRTIIRRRRIKHSISFRDRLLKNAQEARDKAASLPLGAERDRLLLKAQQCESAADIDRWVSSPGSPPPDLLDSTEKLKR